MAGYKLVTYAGAEGPRAGVVIGEQVFDAAKLTGRAADATVLGIMADWPAANARLGKAAAASPGAGQPLASTKLLAPILWPSAIYCAGANYADHAAEMARASGRTPEPDPHTLGLKPWHFLKAGRSTLAGPDDTVRISGLSKTYSITGWRLAYTVACERLTSAIRKVHDFLTVGAPHPLQEAGAAALKLPAKFYADLASMYERKRTTLLDALNAAGLKCRSPQGAYYVIADIGHLGFADDFAAADFLLDQVGVAAVPGSSFYRHPELGKRKIRFTFSKSDETLAAAAERLSKLNERLRAGVPHRRSDSSKT